MLKKIAGKPGHVTLDHYLYGEWKNPEKTSVDLGNYFKDLDEEYMTLYNSTAEVAFIEKQTKRILSEGGSAFFTEPHEDLNPTFWDSDENLLDNIRNEIERVFVKTFEADYKNPTAWGSLWIVGSSTSFQYEETADDLDVQLVVDYENFLKHNPDWQTMDWTDIRADMHGHTVAHIDGSEIVPGVLWQLFVRGEQDAAAFLEAAQGLKQGVYNIDEDRWIIPPIKLEKTFDPLEQFKQWVPLGRMQVQKANDLVQNYRDDPSEQNKKGVAEFYRNIRLGRARAFEGEGGQYGEGNFVWQYMVQFGPMHDMKEIIGAYMLSRTAEQQKMFPSDPRGQFTKLYKQPSNLKIQEHDFEVDDPYEMNRRPTIYDPESNTVHVGPLGAFHSALSSSAGVPYANTGYIRHDADDVPYAVGSYGNVPPEVVDALRQKFGIDNTGEGRDDFKFASSHDLKWEPGQPGKGWVFDDGSVRTWTVDDNSRPYHMHKYKRGEKPLRSKEDGIGAGAFQIQPNGQVHRLGGAVYDEAIPFITQADPRLFAQEEEDPSWDWIGRPSPRSEQEQ